ncbi:hypothetical protein ABAC460_03800 [Asticcacaulis sp. AC460]|nr:hypothetical protein ABAC460_03800 [Asticcacaulis sp. AC460]
MAAGMVLVSGAGAADAGYLQIKGSKQGEFKGDVLAKGKESWNSVIGFDYTAPGARRVGAKSPGAGDLYLALDQGDAAADQCGDQRRSAQRVQVQQLGATGDG